jgi:phospholipid/cholesterol/gamma-HCH transport system ATP-binding protein
MEKDRPDPGVGAYISVQDLTMAYGDYVVQRDINLSIARNEIFIIMGDSGCGKSTLLRHMIGLKKPRAGQIYYGQEDFWTVDDHRRVQLMRNFGILYQYGALWSSMTVAENVALPIQHYKALTPRQINELVSLKLALVGLGGFESFYPSEISGGMRKRAALARAIALDPEVLFFDEPSAGLDPLSARRLDDLILEMRDSMEATIVVVTHELASIFSIGTQAVFLDSDTKTVLATGNPRQLAESAESRKVRSFLNRQSL